MQVGKTATEGIAHIQRAAPRKRPGTKARSRRREEADSCLAIEFPPPHVGGYGTQGRDPSRPVVSCLTRTFPMLELAGEIGVRGGLLPGGEPNVAEKLAGFQQLAF